MKMGKKDPRSSMSKSTKGKPLGGQSGKNPIKSTSPYEVAGVGEGSAAKGRGTRKAPDAEPIADKSSE